MRYLRRTARTAGPYAGPQTGPSPETDVELATQALEPVLFEENAPLSPNTNEPPDSVPIVSEVKTEEPYLLPDATRSYSSAMETFGNVAANVETVAGGPLQPAEVGGSLDEALASLFSGPETTRVPASKVVEDAEPASTGSCEPVESPLRDAPQPASPFAPPAGGSSLSLLGDSPFGRGVLPCCCSASWPTVSSFRGETAGSRWYCTKR